MVPWVLQRVRLWAAGLSGKGETGASYHDKLVHHDKLVVHIFSLVNRGFFLLREVAFCIMPCLQLNEVPGFSAGFNVCCSRELNPLVTLGSSVLCLSHLATGQDCWVSPAPSVHSRGKGGKCALPFEPQVLSRCWSPIHVHMGGVVFAVLQVKRSVSKCFV